MAKSSIFYLQLENKRFEEIEIKNVDRSEDFDIYLVRNNYQTGPVNPNTDKSCACSEWLYRKTLCTIT